MKMLTPSIKTLQKTLLEKFIQSSKNMDNWRFMNPDNPGSMLVTDGTFTIKFYFDKFAMFRDYITIQANENWVEIFNGKIGLFRNRKYYKIWEKIYNKLLDEKNSKIQLEYEQRQHKLLNEVLKRIS